MATRDIPTVVQPCGLCTGSCGYCNSTTSISYEMLTESLSVYEYQELLDRGWERYGRILYKPQMDITCCPSYTFRLKAELFQMSKEHRHAMNRMQRYLDGTYRTSSSDSNMDTSDSKEENLQHKHDQGPTKIEDGVAFSLSNITENAIQSIFLLGKYPNDLEIPKAQMEVVSEHMRKRANLSKDVVYTCGIAFPCAAMLLKHKNLDQILKVMQESLESLAISIQGNSVKEMLPYCLAKLITLAMKEIDDELSKCGFQVEAVAKGYLNFHRKNSNSNPQDALNGFLTTEGDRNPKAKFSAAIQSQNKHVLEIRMRRSDFDPEEFALYKRYVTAVHHVKPEDVSEDRYVRFLVDSPLRYVSPTVENGFSGLGSFHQQYLIDGRIVAVSVVDILPACLFSAYVFWDPDLSFLSLGKYSALREIEWVNQARKLCPTLEYYYLGWYIDSCPKMRYKGAYRPSELLCPVKYTWFPFDLAQPLIHKQPYVRLSDVLDQQSSGMGIQTDIEENNALATSDINNVLLKMCERYARFRDLQQIIRDAIKSHVEKYWQAVGPDLSQRMAYDLIYALKRMAYGLS